MLYFIVLAGLVGNAHAAPNFYSTQIGPVNLTNATPFTFPVYVNNQNGRNTQIGVSSFSGDAGSVTITGKFALSPSTFPIPKVQGQPRWVYNCAKDCGQDGQSARLELTFSTAFDQSVTFFLELNDTDEPDTLGMPSVQASIALACVLLVSWVGFIWWYRKKAQAMAPERQAFAHV